MRDRDALDKEDSAAASTAAESQPTAIENKRQAARRRFMRMGAGGAAGLMVTVVHKRAFAGAKKTTVQSLCGSLQGKPDFIKNGGSSGVTSKKITLSAMGTPKGLVCKNPSPNTSALRENKTKYWSHSPFAAGARKVDVGGGQDWYTFNDNIVEAGYGNLNDTLARGNEWRILEHGYCPIQVDTQGQLVFVPGQGPEKFYYKSYNNYVNRIDPKACK